MDDKQNENLMFVKSKAKQSKATKAKTEGEGEELGKH